MNKRDDPEMQEEYDFSQGVRGKHHEAYRAGHRVLIQRLTAIVEQHFKMEDGAVMLDPDVKHHFPTSEAVNKALRTLIEQG